EMDGLAFLAQVKERDPHVPVILMSGQAGLETAVKATRLGALDFVEKPVGLDRLLLTLRNALRLGRLERENRELQRFWLDEVSLIGDSPPCAPSGPSSSAPRPPTCRSSSWARTVPARSWWLGRSTSFRRAAASP